MVNDRGQCITYFMSSELHMYYKFVDLEVHVTSEWVAKLNNDYHKVLKKWCIKRK